MTSVCHAFIFLGMNAFIVPTDAAYCGLSDHPAKLEHTQLLVPFVRRPIPLSRPGKTPQTRMNAVFLIFVHQISQKTLFSELLSEGFDDSGD